MLWGYFFPSLCSVHAEWTKQLGRTWGGRDDKKARVDDQNDVEYGWRRTLLCALIANFQSDRDKVVSNVHCENSKEQVGLPITGEIPQNADSGQRI